MDNRAEDANSLKRRAKQSDELNKKKLAIHSDISEANKNSTFIKTDEEDQPKTEIQQDVIEGKEEEDELDQCFFLQDFCDEVLYEIFRYLNTCSLMSLMNMCHRFEILIQDKRLWEDIDLSQQPLPLGILEDQLERSHGKTKSIKLRGLSPHKHFEGEVQHFNKTIKESFTTRCMKLVTLELSEVTLDFKKIAFKDFPETLKRLVLNTCNIRVDVYNSLFNGIESCLVNLEELAIEYNSWFDPYYILALSRLPLLRFLSLRGCCQLYEFKLFVNISALRGFKQLEIIDLRDTPLIDSDLRSFYVIETLQEIYLECPVAEYRGHAHASNIVADKINTSNEQAHNSERPSTSKGIGKTDKIGNEISATSYTSSSSPTSSNVAACNSSLFDINILTGNWFTPRAYYIHNHISFEPLMLLKYETYVRFLQRNERTLRHYICGNNVNHLGREVWAGQPNYILSEENSAKLQRPGGTITDNGVCWFDRMRQSVEESVIGIRCYDNRPRQNRFKRFSVRGYKQVTNKSLLDFVQFSTHLIFLDVSGTSVTSEGVKDFKLLREECEVVAEHLTDDVRADSLKTI